MSKFQTARSKVGVQQRVRRISKLQSIVLIITTFHRMCWLHHQNSKFNHFSLKLFSGWDLEARYLDSKMPIVYLCHLHTSSFSLLWFLDLFAIFLDKRMKDCLNCLGKGSRIGQCFSAFAATGLTSSYG